MKKKRLHCHQKTINYDKRTPNNKQFQFEQQRQLELFNKQMKELIHEIQLKETNNSDNCNNQRSEFISKLTTIDLKNLHFYIRQNEQKLVTNNQYSEARNLVLIGEDVDNELQKRGEILDQNSSQKNSNSNSPKKNSTNGSPQSKINSSSPTARYKKALSQKACQRIQKFDDETSELVNRLQNRHDFLFEDYARIWDENMKSHYFTPSKNLQELRQQQMQIRKECIQREKEILYLNEEERMNDPQYQELLNEFYDIDKLIRKVEEEETEVAQQEYENDFMIAQRKLEEKQGVEMQCLLEDRIIKRQRLLLSEGIDVTSYYPSGSKSQLNSRKPSPIHSRKNSPTRSPPKMLPLISYTKHMNSKNSPDTKNEKTPRTITKEAISKVTPNITVDIARSPCLIAIENRITQKMESNHSPPKSSHNSPNKNNGKLPIFRNIKTNEDGTIPKTESQKRNNQVRRKSPQKTAKINKINDIKQSHENNDIELEQNHTKNEFTPTKQNNEIDNLDLEIDPNDDFENNPIPFDRT